MKINLKTATARLFPKHSFEMIYFEAIANSLDAEATKIDILINYDKKFISLNINDNGVGLKEERLERFLNLLDVQDNSHKGQGRLIYLHYFKDVRFESFCKKNNSFERISFNFNYDFNEETVKKETVETTNNSGTNISFENFCGEKIASLEQLRPSSIKEKILADFLPIFHKMKTEKNEFEIKIESSINGKNSSETISINDIPDFENLQIERDYLENISPKLFDKVEGDLFRKPLTLYYHISESSNSSVVTSFAIDNRAIRIPIIDKENYIDGFEAIFFMHSDCFNGQVNPSRQELTIEPNDLKEIKKIFKLKIKDIFAEKIPQFKQNQEKEINNLKDKYPHLIGYLPEDEVGFSARKSILFAARDKFFEEQQQLLEKESLDNEDYQKALELSARNLAEYIIFRQMQIEKLKTINPKALEKEIHDVICPQKSKYNQKNLEIFKNNAWILDDRFMSFSHSFSDLSIKKISELEIFGQKSESLDRPDFLLLFSNTSPEAQEVDIVVFEFKRLNISGKAKMSASNELTDYADCLRDILLNENKKVNRIWLYALVDIDQEFERSLKNKDYKLRFSPQGKIWYHYFENIGTEVSFLDFKALISDAEARNEIFMKILRNEFESN